ncbi:MAG: hypothetical protein IJS32_06825 [Kiritimatiellae bacterium]|nr:hypothetical protein [Kiritimatiellia bacterium]
MSATVPLVRLPFELREELCQRLRDRVPAPKIAAWLEGLGHGRYTPQQISKFRHSKQGYQEWLAEQRKLDERRARSESVRREVNAAGWNLLDKNMLDLVEMLSDPGLDPIKATSALATIKNAVTAEKRLELEKERVALAKDDSKREWEKHRYAVAKDALRIFEDRRAREIAEGSGTQEEKLAALVAYMDRLEREAAG